MDLDFEKRYNIKSDIDCSYISMPDKEMLDQLLETMRNNNSSDINNILEQFNANMDLNPSNNKYNCVSKNYIIFKNFEKNNNSAEA